MTGRAVGLVLAAGEGRRLGSPKALVTDEDGQTWLARAVGVLHESGIATVYLVVGAEASRVAAVAPADVHVVTATDWAEGMGASLRAGLSAMLDADVDAECVVVQLVDTPGIGADVVRRIVEHGAPDTLIRAAYDGRPGHPVVIGRAHWQGVIASASGDRGARDYLARHNALAVECGDMSSGVDIDTPEALAEWRQSRPRRQKGDDTPPESNQT